MVGFFGWGHLASSPSTFGSFMALKSTVAESFASYMLFNSANQRVATISTADGYTLGDPDNIVDTASGKFIRINGGSGIERFRVNGSTGDVTTRGIITERVGTSTDNAIVGGTVHLNPTSANNILTTKTDLMTKTIVANSISSYGTYIEFEGYGRFANNSSLKRLKVEFDGNVILDTNSLAFQNSTWRVRGKIVSLGTSTVKTCVEFISDDAILRTELEINPFLSVDLTTDRILKFTGQGTNTNDIVQDLLEVEWKKPYTAVTP
jgi:hypothetical protein